MSMVFPSILYAASGQSAPENIACFQSGGSCRMSCPLPGVASGNCVGGLVCCKW